MFTNLRKSAQGFFAKLILILLTAMFVLWGIGDVFRNMGGPSGDLATVGKQTITMQQLHEAIQRSHKPVQDAFVGLINDSLVSQEAKAMGIEVDDDEVVRFISALPEFQDSTGAFDKALYQKFITNDQMDEARFIEDIRHEIAAKLLIDMFSRGLQAPDAVVNSVYKSQEEQRTAELFIVPVSLIANQIKAPDDKEIKAYYDAHPKDFTAPEYRTLTYVTLPIEDVLSKVEVSDDEIKHVYEDRIQEFHRPERRELEQLVFKTQEAAKKAFDQLQGGAAFDAFAQSADILNKGKLSMGELSQPELPAEAQNAKVFTLKAGEASAPVQSDFGWHIFYVRQITPEGPLPLEKVRADISKEIALRQAQETAMKLINGFEDTLAGGATLAQAAEKIGEKTHTLGPVSQAGLTPDGKKADVPPYKAFLNIAFTTADKERSQAIQDLSGSYFLVHVDSIAAAHVRPLEQVKDAAMKQALQDKTKTAFTKAMEKVSEELHAGKPPAQALAANGLMVAPVVSGNLKRAFETLPDEAFKGKKLPHAFMSELFHIYPNQSTHAYPLDPGSYVIATLSKVIPAPMPPDPKVIDGLRLDVKATLTDETLHSYLNYLRSKYPIALKQQNVSALKSEDSGE